MYVYTVQIQMQLKSVLSEFEETILASNIVKKNLNSKDIIKQQE